MYFNPLCTIQWRDEVPFHYQKTAYSWRPKTVRKGLNTVRDTIPDGLPSGMRRQDHVVRKGGLFLSAVPVGCPEDGFKIHSWQFFINSWRQTVRKPGKRVLKKYIHTDTDLRPCRIVSYTCHLQFVHLSSIQTNLSDSSVHMSTTIVCTYTSDWHPLSYSKKMNKWVH